ncbi:MAG: TIGR00730 family Rossman fold protein [Parcubacteria group bacterium]
MSPNSEVRLQKPTPHKILSKKELHKTATERVELIAKEFTDGFRFIEDYPRSVTFFGGARFTENSPYYKKAQSISNRIAKELKYAVFSGGGPGIMEAANRGAFEVGGDSLGLTIELSHEQTKNSYLTGDKDFYYFFSRKVLLSFSAESYIFMPGGFGTLDEFFEILTLVQTNKIESVPIILVGSDFWKPLDEFIKRELLGRDTIDENDLNLYTITDDEDEILKIIRNAPIRNGLEFTHKDLEKHGLIIEPKKIVL